MSPIGLGMTSMALLGAGGHEQRRLQRGVGRNDVVRAGGGAPRLVGTDGGTRKPPQDK